jgi:hypothetical protein
MSLESMKQVVTVKLPEATDRAALIATMRRCNELANQVSATAYRDRRNGKIERLAALHRRVTVI